jgi:hypothetical protein
VNQRYFIATLALAGLFTPLLAVIPAQSQASAQAPVQTGKKQASAVTHLQTELLTLSRDSGRFFTKYFRNHRAPHARPSVAQSPR